MPTFSLSADGLSLNFNYTSGSPVVMTAGARTPASGSAPAWLRSPRMVELQAAGFNPDTHHGNKYAGSSPGDQLRHVSHRRRKEPGGGVHLEIEQAAPGLRVVTHIRTIPGAPAFRTWNEIGNTGTAPLILEYAGSLSLPGISRDGAGRWADKMRLHVADNNFCAECQWRSGSPGDFGLHQFYPQGNTGAGIARISFSNQGTWSSGGMLPVAMIENTETGETLFWQIEHNGSWQWEISDQGGELYLLASGPTWRESHWSRRLAPGESFTSATVACGRVRGGWQEALRALTVVRRHDRRRNTRADALPVIFNDYMNCLWADPSETRELPLISRAAEIGCEYFVIDAGWYAEAGRSWWDTVGEWRPAPSRFPNGFGAVFDAIRAHGMTPGLWMEIEVMGIHCPLAATLPDDWFFLSGGKRVVDHGRYQLDFANPAVRAHADDVMDRLIHEFGLGYIKMDYNINVAPGTDKGGTRSLGDGLLEHNRAYLAWVGSLLDRHPDLIIENCSAGGMRIDYAMLRVHALQSMSDQAHFHQSAYIAASAAAAVLPEQAAVWSYPGPDGGEEESIFNLVGTLLLRAHHSGPVCDLRGKGLVRVKEAIALYKNLRADIPCSLPFWPLGLPRHGDGWLAYGLDTGDSAYLALWRLDGKSKTQTLRLPAWKGRGVAAACIYPENKPVAFSWDASRGELTLTLPRHFSARLFKLIRHGLA